jgi:hypothetical protein
MSDEKRASITFYGFEISGTLAINTSDMPTGPKQIEYSLMEPEAQLRVWFGHGPITPITDQPVILDDYVCHAAPGEDRRAGA